MKVYIVMYNDGGNAYVKAVYSNKEEADKWSKGSLIYDTYEWEVQ